MSITDLLNIALYATTQVTKAIESIDILVDATSTVGGLVLPDKKLLFQESHFCVPTSATSRLAEDQSETLKTNLYQMK